MGAAVSTDDRDRMGRVTRHLREVVACLTLLLATAPACSSTTSPTGPASSTSASLGPPTGADSGVGLPDELDVKPSLSLGCEGIALPAPPENFEVVSDVVALPSSPDHPALQTSRREASDGTTYFFAKTGLIWKKGTSFMLVVPDSLRSRMAIGWGGPAPHGHSVEVSCDVDGEALWVGLPGGYWVTEPLCADLLVRTETEEISIQVGIGLPCASQQSPHGPSDS